jgi:hypothetical protein
MTAFGQQPSLGQTFFYWLKELNDYVDWLPGAETKLTEIQLNLAFLPWIACPLACSESDCRTISLH